jgi:trehalose 6-phosphate phosphatase
MFQRKFLGIFMGDNEANAISCCQENRREKRVVSSHIPDIPVKKENSGNYAWLFDVDGTLAPIADQPEQVQVTAMTMAALQQLHSTSCGAVAIVSGRSLAQIDRLLHPYVFCAAGLHGTQWRGPDGLVHQLDVNTASVATMVERLVPVTQRLAGVQLEHKGLALALHYRHAPAHATALWQAVEGIVATEAENFVLQPGKMVIEIKPRQASKGLAIGRLMSLAPFKGRTPCFAGDDLTDEAGFEVVNALGGITIKIGEGESQAAWRLPTPLALTNWLTLLGQ